MAEGSEVRAEGSERRARSSGHQVGWAQQARPHSYRPAWADSTLLLVIIILHLPVSQNSFLFFTERCECIVLGRNSEKELESIYASIDRNFTARRPSRHAGRTTGRPHEKR